MLAQGVRGWVHLDLGGEGGGRRVRLLPLASNAELAESLSGVVRPAGLR